MRRELQSIYNEKPYSAGSGFGVLKQNPLEVLTHIDIIKIVAKGAGLDISDLSWIEDTFQDAKARAEAARGSVFR